MLQYRNKRDDDLLVTQDALVIRDAALEKAIALQAPPMRLILNDRPDLVAPAGWDGVHLGQDDPAPAEVRALLGPRAFIGLSTNNDEQIRLADTQPVDYIAVGPVFRTFSKTNPSPVIGVSGVERLRSLTTRPLVAIGGITIENAPSVYDAGADSVAVISALFAPGRSPAQSVRDFLAIFK